MPDFFPLLDQARERVARQYGYAIGRRRDELVTPALVLDIDAAQRNIDHMANSLREMGAATIRPHYKTHKSPEIARRQVAAGAGGLSMATVWEAAVLAGAGMDVLSAAAVKAGATLGILVEVDTGMDRCGVDTAPDGLALARHVASLPGLRFEGVTGYEGHCSMTIDNDLRHELQGDAMPFFTGLAELIEEHRIDYP